jgi:flavin reductase (DIM6/NTAB) family NADH-FMN oxidoreductase RutF
MSTTNSAQQAARRPDFKDVEKSRPEWKRDATVTYTKTIAPEWNYGEGANDTYAPAAAAKHISINPYEEGRPAGFNYKLMISGVTPRPIAFVSSRSADGKVTNLAPFSYFNMISHDPPLLVIGFSGGMASAKDSLRNILDSKECVVNIISEHYVEAANSASIDAPYGKSEWAVSGLTPVYDCQNVKCARVKEAIFSIECKLDFYRENESRATPGKKTGVMCVLEGTNFWVREDALNDEKSIVDLAVLKPISRLGGITYGRTNDVMELPRAKYTEALGDEAYSKLKQPEHAPLENGHANGSA